MTFRFSRLLGVRFAKYYRGGFTVRSVTMCADSSVQEGKANIIFPTGVFYNPVQEFNRDITIAIITQYEKYLLQEFYQKRMRKTGDSAEVHTYEGLRILEALAATGIRSIRFALEIPHLNKVITNDIDPEAVTLIEKNVKRNCVSDKIVTTCNDAVDLMYRSRVFTERFNVVDIDPYGTAAPFLDTAVQCLHNGGLLCVTSTDMAVLCGSTPGTSMGKYGGIAIKNSATHEVGIRILLNAIQSAASRHGKIIEPLVSLSVDFYARVFVRVWSSPKSVKGIASKHGICFTCSGCLANHIQPLGQAVDDARCVVPAHGPCVGPTCTICGSSFHVWGPLWIGPLHNQKFLKDFLSNLGFPPKEYNKLNSEGGDKVHELNPADIPIPTNIIMSPNLTQPEAIEPAKQYNTLKRIVGMCTMAYEELPDIPLYSVLNRLASVLRCLMPPLLSFHSAILNAGYRVSVSHADTNTIKTDAPHSLLIDILLAHYRQFQSDSQSSKQSTSEPNTNLPKADSKKSRRSFRRHTRNQEQQNSPEPSRDLMDGGDERIQSHHDRVRTILHSRPNNPLVDFTLHPLANPPSRTENLVRYQMNPEKNWGPKSRPKRLKLDDQQTSNT